MPTIGELPVTTSLSLTDEFIVQKSDGNTYSVNTQIAANTIISSAFVNILNYRAGVTDDVALANAFAALPSTGGSILIPAIGSPYTFTAPVVLANKPVALIGDSSAVVEINVTHLLQALTITQTNGANNTEIRGLTFALAVTGTSIGCVLISYPSTGESPLPAVKVVDLNVEISATGSPVWGAGLTISGATAPPATLGVVQIQRYAFEGALTNLPAPTGSYGLVLNSVNDCDVKDYLATNCDVAIYVGSYCEGLRFQSGSCVSCNWLMKMPAGITLGPGTPGGTLTVQKMWFHDWEVATYSGGFNVYSVSETFLSDMDLVGLYGSNWTAFELTDCFGWQGSDIYIDGLVATGVPYGFNLTASGTTNQYCGDFQFPSLNTNRLSYSVYLGSGVQYCSFENLLPRFGVPGSSLPVNNVQDASGNSTNRITFGNKNGNLSSTKGYLQFDSLDYSPGIKFTFGVGAVNYLNTLNAGTGNAPTLAAAGSDTNVTLALSSKGNAPIAFQNSVGLLAEIIGPASPVNYLTLNAVTSGNAPAIAAVGTDTNISLQLTTKGSGQFVVTNGTTIIMNLIATGTIANYPSLGAVASGSAVSYGVNGSDANISIVLSPKGSGSAYVGSFQILTSQATTTSTTNTVTNKIKVVIGGTTYYLLASTSGT